MSLSLGWSTHVHLSLTWILTVNQSTCLHFALVLSMATPWPHLYFSMIIKPKCTFGKNTTYTHVLSCSVMSDSLWPHGLEFARLLCLWGVRGSSRPRDQAQISCTAGRFFTSWVIVCLKKVRSIPQTFLFALRYHYFRHFHFFPCASTRPYTKQTRDRYVREKME